MALVANVIAVSRNEDGKEGKALWFAIPFAFLGRKLSRGYLVDLGDERTAMSAAEFNGQYTVLPGVFQEEDK